MKHSYLIFVKLTKIYLSSTFSLKQWATMFTRKKKGGDTNTLSVKKIIGMTFLFLILLIEIGLVYGTIQISMYDGLKPYNMQDSMFIMTAYMVSSITLIFGVLQILASYHVDTIDNNLLPLPVTPRVMFAAKIASSAVAQILPSLILFGIMLGIYGFFEQPFFMFYIYGIVCAVVLPLPLIALLYVLIVPLMSVTSVFKNKRLITVLGSVVGITFALGINFFMQSMNKSGSNASIEFFFRNSKDWLASTAGYYFPVFLTHKILQNNAHGIAFLLMLSLIAVTAVILWGIVSLFARAYAKSLVGFGETALKKMAATKAELFIRKRSKKRPPFVSLIMREMKMLHREPAFLFNGPLMMIIMPVVLGVSVFGSAKNGISSEDIHYIRLFILSGEGTVLLGVVAAWIGTLSNIAPSALSRDAKNIIHIKALPIHPAKYFGAKLAHATLLTVAGIVVILSVVAVIVAPSPLVLGHAAVISVVISLVLNTAALLLDMYRPKCNWNMPIEAVKNNTNILVSIFFDILFLGGLTLLVIFLPITSQLKPILLELLFIIIAVIMLRVLVKKSAPCLEKLEE